MSVLPRMEGIPCPAASAAVRGIVGRCAPWIHLHVCERICDPGCTGKWISLGRGEGIILVANEWGYAHTLQTAHHEVWHAVEWWMTADAIASVSEMTENGHAVPGDYMSSPVERRARLYASLATAWDEGLYFSGPPDHALDLMWRVYTGDAATEVMRLRAERDGPDMPPPPARGRWRRIWDAIWN